MAWRLSGEHDGTPIRLLVTGADQRLGAAPDCDLHLPFPTVSRHHARLSVTDDGLEIEDLGSSNGTRLDGTKLSAPTLAAAGGRLHFGEIELEVRDVAAGDVRVGSEKWLVTISGTDSDPGVLARLPIEAAAGEVPLRPGVRRLMQAARDAGLRLAIASSSLRANVQALLAHGLSPDALDWFEAIVTGDDVASKKPDPEIYRRVLERLELPASACVAVEDSQNGCRAATAMGIPTIVTTSSYTDEHEFEGSLLVADSLGEPDAPWQIIAGSADGVLVGDPFTGSQNADGVAISVDGSTWYPLWNATTQSTWDQVTLDLEDTSGGSGLDARERALAAADQLVRLGFPARRVDIATADGQASGPGIILRLIRERHPEPDGA